MNERRGARVATGTMTGTALLLALGVVLPIVFHAMPLGGRVFLPMHIPTFIAGLVLGPVAGLVVGFGSPVLSGLITGRPTFLYMIPMIFELSTYGFVAGLLRPRFCAMLGGSGPVWATHDPVAGSTARAQRAPIVAVWLALVSAMIAGRAVWLAVVVWFFAFLARFAPDAGLRARTVVAAIGAIGAGWIGMVIQLAIIPPIVRAIERLRHT